MKSILLPYKIFILLYLPPLFIYIFSATDDILAVFLSKVLSSQPQSLQVDSSVNLKLKRHLFNLQWPEYKPNRHFKIFISRSITLLFRQSFKKHHGMYVSQYSSNNFFLQRLLNALLGIDESNAGIGSSPRDTTCSEPFLARLSTFSLPEILECQEPTQPLPCLFQRECLG